MLKSIYRMTTFLHFFIEVGTDSFFASEAVGEPDGLQSSVYSACHACSLLWLFMSTALP